MRLHRAFGALFAALTVTLAARGAAAQLIADPWATGGDSIVSADGNPSAPNPQKQKTLITVRFADSAAGLPREDIRVAIARELDNQPLEAKLTAGELRIAVEAEHLVVGFRSAQNYTERVLTLPKERDQVPVVLGLIAVNLARDQSADVRDQGLTAPVPFVPTAHEYSRHYLGLHLAQDLLVTGGNTPCNLDSQSTYTPFACYEQDTGNAYRGYPNPIGDSLSRRLTLATTRVLASYDFALIPEVTLGARLGFSVRGSPPVTQPSWGNGQPRFPFHLEIRSSFWLVPLTSEPWHVFAGFSAGFAQVSAKRTHTIEDCGMSNLDGGPLDSDTFQACRTGAAQGVGQTKTLDVWSKTGQAFVGGHAGATFTMAERLLLELNVNLQYMFRVNAVVPSPSLGVVYAL